MQIYLLLFIVQLSYLTYVWYARYRAAVHVDGAGAIRKMLEDPIQFKMVGYDVGIVVTFLANIVLGLRTALDLSNGGLLHWSIWALFAALAVSRMNVEIAASELAAAARKGDEA